MCLLHFRLKSITLQEHVSYTNVWVTLKEQVNYTTGTFQLHYRIKSDTLMFQLHFRHKSVTQHEQVSYGMKISQLNCRGMSQLPMFYTREMNWLQICMSYTRKTIQI